MSGRKELQKALCWYIVETFSYIDSVRSFCEKISEWVNMRGKERKMMMYIKNRADKVKQSQDEVQVFEEYMKSKKTELDADPEEQLAVVLEDTLRGLEELDCFLDAVEKLAVTSLHVFMENQVFHLPGIKFEDMQIIMVVARMICPLLLKFKRDAKDFFLPKLQNVEVLSNQLDVYIETTQKICQALEKSSFGDFCRKMKEQTQVDLDDVSEDGIGLLKMLDHIKDLYKIRMNQPFRTVLMFQKESCSSFINEFKKRKPRMLQCLKELEECAVQLVRMNKGSKISSVAATGIGVNATQQKKANKVFKVFMEDVQAVQACLGEVISQTVSKIDVNKIKMMKDVGMVLGKAGGVGKGIHSLVLEASDVCVFVGAKAAKGPLSKLARAGTIALNALSLGMDIFFICKDSVSLAKGSETEVSQFIRARSALWSSEIDSWQKIHNALSEGLQKSERKKALLETPFYPEEEEEDTKVETHEGPGS